MEATMSLKANLKLDLSKLDDAAFARYLAVKYGPDCHGLKIASEVESKLAHKRALKAAKALAAITNETQAVA